MKFIDAHLHLDPNIDGSLKTAAQVLNSQLELAGVSRCILLHLEQQPWTAEEVAEEIEKYERLKAFINIHPKEIDAKEKLKHGIEQLGYIGLKLHPRLQEFPVDDSTTISLIRFAGELNIPVLIDAFPDGTHLMQGFSPVKYAAVAKECPHTKIIWAHMGGHYVLDFMMLAKRLPNVYMDCSYALLYYQNSPTTDNMIYAMRSMQFNRLFYGSDYPDRRVDVSLKRSIEILKGHGVNDENLDKLMFSNAKEFFGWADL